MYLCMVEVLIGVVLTPHSVRTERTKRCDKMVTLRLQNKFYAGNPYDSCMGLLLYWNRSNWRLFLKQILPVRASVFLLKMRRQTVRFGLHLCSGWSSVICVRIHWEAGIPRPFMSLSDAAVECRWRPRAVAEKSLTDRVSDSTDYKPIAAAWCTPWGALGLRSLSVLWRQQLLPCYVSSAEQANICNQHRLHLIPFARLTIWLKVHAMWNRVWTDAVRIWNSSRDAEAGRGRRVALPSDFMCSLSSSKLTFVKHVTNVSGMYQCCI